jgi:hypothetical protein
MNRRWTTAGALALAFLAVSAKTALAQDHGEGSSGQHSDEWNRQHHTTFNDQERQATRDWYREHQHTLGAGWRQKDRLSPDMEARLRPGERLDPELRRQMHSLPGDLRRRYGAAPNGYRYGVIGGNVVMLDNDYHVHDVFRLEISAR